MNIKSINLKISLEVSDPIDNSYEDIKRFVNEAVLNQLMIEYKRGMISNFKMLVELEKNNDKICHWENEGELTGFKELDNPECP